MQKGKLNICTDSMWGSCSKGSTATALAHKYCPEIISTTSQANAGHTAVNEFGHKFVAKALPSPAILARWNPKYRPQIIVGASAAFHLNRLLEEVRECCVHDALTIHPRAGVITEEHRLAESGNGSESTRHIASTMQGCGAFLADKVLRKKDLKLAKDYSELAEYMVEHLSKKLLLNDSSLIGLSLPETLHKLMKEHNYTILHEGAQGFSLDINHGSHWPTCTSRGTTAIQNMADLGISPKDLGDIYLVMRPYPIRVGNLIVDGQQVGYSGDGYPDQQEITWQQVAEEAGMPPEVAESLLKTELTTVTKRLRRVFTFSERQLREAALVNGATKIALNFANYIDYKVYGVNDYNKLTPKVKDFIVMVEEITKIPVTMIGTGPQLNHVCII